MAKIPVITEIFNRLLGVETRETQKIVFSGARVTGQSIPNNSSTIIVLDEYSNIAEYVSYNPATGEVTINKSGDYMINMSLAVDGPYGAGSYIAVRVHLNGTNELEDFVYAQTAFSQDMCGKNSRPFTVSAGTVVTLRLQHTAGDTRPVLPNRRFSFLTITRL